MVMQAGEDGLYLKVGVDTLKVQRESGLMLVDYLQRLKEWRILVYGD
jgi:hypothetical protein